MTEAGQTVIVAEKKQECEGVVSLLLVPRPGEHLPPFEAGSHVDVQVRPGLVRQYSLANDPRDRDRYLLGVLRGPASRGGSASLHDEVMPGDELAIGAPRNLFPLDETAQHSILLGGGIGVTPLLAMAHRLQALERPFELHLCCRTQARVPFGTQLHDCFGAATSVHLDDALAGQRLQLAAVLGSPDAGRHLYVCGPSGFIDWAVAQAQRTGWASANIHVERFDADPQLAGGSFEVVLARSGMTLHVAPDETLADVLTRHGVPLSVSCEKGICGTCLTPVLEGIPDHRDLYQTDEQKDANTHITPCCSRAVTPRLVLEL